MFKAPVRPYRITVRSTPSDQFHYKKKLDYSKTYLNLIRDITGPNISSLAIAIFSYPRNTSTQLLL